MDQRYPTLARYSRWANERLYAELAKLTPSQLAATTAVNFGSIIGIANHLVLADRLWLNRMTGAGEPVTTVDAVPYPELPALAAARRIEEERCLDWLADLDPAVLSTTLRFVTTEGVPSALPFEACLIHFFNHQTHHRGQIHGLVGAFDLKAADIDLLGYLRQVAAG